MSSVTVSGVVSPYTKQDGTRQVRMRVTFKRKARYISTNIFVYPHQLGKNGNIKDKELQSKILSLEMQMYEKIREIPLLSISNMEIEDVISLLTKEDSKTFHLDILKFFDECSKDKKTSTRKSYEYAKKIIISYLGREDLDIWEVNIKFLDKFMDYLIQRYGRRGSSTNCIYGHFSYVYKRAVRVARREVSDIIISNPFVDYDNTPQPPIPKHRNVDQELIQSLIDIRSSIKTNAKKRSVDVFLLSFILMGINTIDIFNAPAPANGIITYDRTKVKDRRSDRGEVQVRIPEFAMSLYKRYADPTKKRAFRFYRDFSCYTAFYSSIRMSFNRFKKMYGYDNSVSLYSARHSWATLCNKYKVNKSIINDGLGHVDRDMKVTDIYIKKDWSNIWEESERMLSNFDWTSIR